MKADAFLGRLEKVKRTGNGQWIACCPAHQDRHPSMTVRALEDERVLVHCFAGCSVEEILRAVAMDFDALFPDRALDHQVKPVRRPFNAGDVLECVAQEALIASVAAAALANGEGLSAADHARLKLATERLHDAGRLANG